MSFLDILLQTPVFQGVGRSDLTSILEKYNIGFLKFKQGELIVEKGEHFEYIKFLISGKILCETDTKSGLLLVKEVIAAPNIISGNYIFGLETHSVSKITAHSEVGIMQLAKEDFLDLLRKEPIFHLNYLNFLSYKSQKNAKIILSLSTGTIKERFAMWVLLLTRKKSREILFVAKIDDLSRMLGESRENFEQALLEFRRAGLLMFSESEIKIIDRHGFADLIEDEDDEADEDDAN